MSHEAGTRLSLEVSSPALFLSRQTTSPKRPPPGINTKAIKMDLQLQLFLSYAPNHSWAQMTWISEHTGQRRGDGHERLRLMGGLESAQWRAGEGTWVEMEKPPEEAAV